MKIDMCDTSVDGYWTKAFSNSVPRFASESKKGLVGLLLP